MSKKLNVMLELYRDNDRMMGTVERVNDSYLEMLDALEVLEDENAKMKAYIEQIESQNARLREYAKLMYGHIKECCDACGERGICDVDVLTRSLKIEVGE